MSSTHDEKDPAAGDRIQRGVERKSLLGTAAFFGTRFADPFLQYNILSNGAASGLVERLGGSVLPQGPPLLTGTALDGMVGLSPYRSILLAMSVGSMLKHNFWILAINREQIDWESGAMVGGFNAVFNSLNSLLFVCSQTSASVNGEHFPQTPLIVGATLYAAGILIETTSEVQRAMFKRDPANKGKVYEQGLFGLSRHINYFGYTMWRSGYALAAGGWVWGAIVAAFFSWDFTQRTIPALQQYLQGRYGEDFEHYKQTVPYKFAPFLY